MISLVNLSCPLEVMGRFNASFDHTVFRKLAAKHLKLTESQIKDVRLCRHSIDARKKDALHYVVKLDCQLADAALEARLISSGKAQKAKPYQELKIPARRLDWHTGSATPQGLKRPRPVVVGLGPAGLFAALYLARAGLKPLVIERGQCVEDRARTVAAFNTGADLNPASNIQFGEGGAGTFSDGKLTTNTKNPYVSHVLHWLYKAGAPREILLDAHPHIGSDKLPAVVACMREEIKALGGDVRFNTTLTQLNFSDAGTLTSIELASAEGSLVEEPCEQLILACGHSARDTFRMLYAQNCVMEQKPFAMGVRIEHPQDLINRSQWGCPACSERALGAAEYKLAVHLPSKRGVYTFCMCPGGEVVCAASEPGRLVVNGMSNFARNGANANSAVLVGLEPKDFGSLDVLAGMELQERIEEAAFRLSARVADESPDTQGQRYLAPVERVEDFLNKSQNPTPSTLLEPSYARGVVWADLHECLPAFIAEPLAEGIQELNKRLRGFAHPDAVLTGVETRSSSPVRLVRGSNYQAPAPGCGLNSQEAKAQAGTSGLYPCGEGAGYAGGIMSAAVDGLRVAEKLAEAYPERI